MTDHNRRDELQGEVVHVYDGIEEADNSLPRWWVAVFVGTIGFGIAYWFGYEVYHLRPTPKEEYVAERVALDQAALAAAASAADASDEMLIALATNANAVTAGATLFKQNCAACHGDRAEGKIGPNLTDRYWLHGGAPLAIHKSVVEGYGAKGMPPWGSLLGKASTQKVVAYVISLRNTQVPGKAPQGEPDLVASAPR